MFTEASLMMLVIKVLGHCQDAPLTILSPSDKENLRLTCAMGYPQVYKFFTQYHSNAFK
jgi:hypothetical protein